jgi:hypothetical protein
MRHLVAGVPRPVYLDFKIKKKIIIIKKKKKKKREKKKLRGARILNLVREKQTQFIIIQKIFY